MTFDPTQRKPRKKQQRAAQPIVVRPHGWGRAGERQELGGPGEKEPKVRTPAGTSLLLSVLVAFLGAIGIVRVHASTRVLQMGAQITELTSEQAQLLEQKRRLAAERAYLRHPDQISEVARDQLGLVPISPELVQEIRVVEEASEQ